ncbi:hypothetical protein CVT26_010515 [Gymnopilus dilepis]|uniref:Uncharacterized protein n=1 Tax=Gymnopilus dilepis TaxID=231916 RepID=A0A409Y0G1_9AGAR|nr:hypothetical protein CVT26_010515 [Gymnopilus dilepis]
MSSVETARPAPPGFASPSSESRATSSCPEEGCGTIRNVVIRPSAVLKLTYLRTRGVAEDSYEEGLVRQHRASLRRAEAEEAFARKCVEEIRAFGLADRGELGSRTPNFVVSIAAIMARSVEEVFVAEKDLVDAQIEECISRLHVLRRLQEEVQGCVATAKSQVASVQLALRGSGATDGDIEQNARSTTEARSLSDPL